MISDERCDEMIATVYRTIYPTLHRVPFASANERAIGRAFYAAGYRDAQPVAAEDAALIGRMQMYSETDDYCVMGELLRQAADRIADLSAELRRARQRITKLERQVREAEREQRDAANGAKTEEYWQNKQGDEYGSY